jgi:hypothetical protein
MQYDHDSERITFELPKVVEGHDMTTCNRIEVHYLNIDALTKEQRGDLYDVDDIGVSPNDENIAICSWLIDGKATQLVGPLWFRLRFVCTTEGAVDYAWHTAVYKGIYVSEGIYNGAQIAEEYSDILAAWDERLEAMEDAIAGAVRADAEQEMTEEQKAQARQNIDAMSEDDVKSLFDDLANDAPLCVQLLTGTMEANKTIDEISDAYLANRNVIFVSTYDEVYIVTGHQPGRFDFERIYGGTEGTTRKLTLSAFSGWTMGAEESNGAPLCVELDNATMTASKTYTEIETAYFVGRTVFVRYYGRLFYSSASEPGSIRFTQVMSSSDSSNPKKLIVNRADTWTVNEVEFNVDSLPIVTDISSQCDDKHIPTTEAVLECVRQQIGLLNNVAEVGA